MIGALLHGSGLRLIEALHLRIKDVDLDRGELIVRAGKGKRDRMTMAPMSSAPPSPLSSDAGWVALPDEISFGSSSTLRPATSKQAAGQRSSCLRVRTIGGSARRSFAR